MAGLTPVVAGLTPVVAVEPLQHPHRPTPAVTGQDGHGWIGMGGRTGMGGRVGMGGRTGVGGRIGMSGRMTLGVHFADHPRGRRAG